MSAARTMTCRELVQLVTDYIECALSVEERSRFVIATGDSLHPLPRLTFTFPAIARARLAVITVAGTEKRDAVERIWAGADLPAARIRAERVLWLGDRAAMGAQ